ncbi:hypothetical protein DSO57_1020101 [Entomophthora muscae]|uniref:Uncharacterized protein n=1 Tax=Entomophthora muscae TaxID=34485 RepID=A0ACC2U1M1_9FUNG|nr:hypothetical protein DSO57_1020101 [Entomophthora muscae]
MTTYPVVPALARFRSANLLLYLLQVTPTGLEWCTRLLMLGGFQGQHYFLDSCRFRYFSSAGWLITLSVLQVVFREPPGIR